ncbi:MAG: MarR family transcriptional regulator [Lysobacterales bacterium]
MRQVELAERLEVKPITLARLIDQLAQACLVERQADLVARLDAVWRSTKP